MGFRVKVRGIGSGEERKPERRGGQGFRVNPARGDKGGGGVRALGSTYEWRKRKRGGR